MPDKGRIKEALPPKVIYFVSYSTQGAVIGLFRLFLRCSWLALGLLHLFLACSWVVQVVLGLFRGVLSFSNDRQILWKLSPLHAPKVKSIFPSFGPRCYDSMCDETGGRTHLVTEGKVKS